MGEGEADGEADGETEREADGESFAEGQTLRRRRTTPAAADQRDHRQPSRRRNRTKGHRLRELCPTLRRARGNGSDVPGMVTIQHLVKRYGARLAVDDLSFDVPKGEVVGFLGPNGAGKSTTLRVIAGFLGMTSSKVTVDGLDVVTDSYAARQRIGYMPEAVPALSGDAYQHEYLAFRAELKGVPRKQRKANVDLAMEESQRHRRRVRPPSASCPRGTGSVSGWPTPWWPSRRSSSSTSPPRSLDPNQIVEVREVVKALGREHTVLPVDSHPERGRGSELLAGGRHRPREARSRGGHPATSAACVAPRRSKSPSAETSRSSCAS